MRAPTYRPSLTLGQIRDASSRIAALTPRGRDVLSGILAGRSNKMIAHSLGISPRTVETHRARMMRDLGARHVADAIRLACEAMEFRQHALHDTSVSAGQKAGAKPFVPVTWK
jgi:DNA-binding NarL/FixJ family response regulator